MCAVTTCFAYSVSDFFFMISSLKTNIVLFIVLFGLF